MWVSRVFRTVKYICIPLENKLVEIYDLLVGIEYERMNKILSSERLKELLFNLFKEIENCNVLES